MLAKPIDQLAADDIAALVAGGVSEARRLEYKLTLPGGSDADKREFLADVTSFANAGGGDLIYGIREHDGVAGEAVGLVDLDEDSERLRLESIIRDGAAPRIPGIQMKCIPGFSEGSILVVRVPRSWVGPHMVTYRGSSRFFTRSSNGKFQMDIAELRSAFEGSSGVSERIAQWRDERLGRVVANEGPIRLSSGACLVVHLVPLESLASEWRLHGTEFASAQVPFGPIDAGGWNHRLNVDGLVTYAPDREADGFARNYTQLFRSCRVEAVTADILTERDGVRWIASIYYERSILAATERFVNGLRGLGVQPPIAFLLSLVGARGAYMYTDPIRSGHSLVPIDRDVIRFPDVVIESFDDELPRVLRPAFDSVWNACGLPQSMNYDANGNWSPR